MHGSGCNELFYVLFQDPSGEDAFSFTVSRDLRNCSGTGENLHPFICDFQTGLDSRIVICQVADRDRRNDFSGKLRQIFRKRKVRSDSATCQ